MTTEAIKKNLLDSVASTIKIDQVDRVSLTLETNFKTDLNLDSLDEIEVCMNIEKVFDVIITDEEFERITKVGDYIPFLEAKTAGKTLYGT